jgi:hypothetical protein
LQRASGVVQCMSGTRRLRTTIYGHRAAQVSRVESTKSSSAEIPTWSSNRSLS